VGNDLKEVKSEGLAEGEFFIILNRHDIQQVKTKVTIEVIANHKVVNEIKTNFLGIVSDDEENETHDK